MGRVIGWGIFIATFGVGSLILPLFGVQFKLFMFLEAMLGSLSWLGSIVLILIGAGLVVMDVKSRKK